MDRIGTLVYALCEGPDRFRILKAGDIVELYDSAWMIGRLSDNKKGGLRFWAYEYSFATNLKLGSRLRYVRPGTVLKSSVIAFRARKALEARGFTVQTVGGQPCVRACPTDGPSTYDPDDSEHYWHGFEGFGAKVPRDQHPGDYDDVQADSWRRGWDAAKAEAGADEGKRFPEETADES